MIVRMFMRGKKKYLIGAAASAVLMLAEAVMFLPGFDGSGPPPDTIGADIVMSGSDFLEGELEGVGLAETTAGGVLTLNPDVGQGGYTSDSVRADYPFNALGLHWAAQAPPDTQVIPEVRFSEDGLEWGDWKQVIVREEDLPDHINQTSSAGETIGQLVFAEAPVRFFQYRFSLIASAAGESPQVSKLTASYIDAKGYHESPLSVATIKRSVDGLVKPKAADAQPAIISRAQWGANEAYMTWDPEYVEPKKLIVHHTVTSNYDPDPAATVRSIYYYHAVSLGWGDIGYNYLIDWRGNIYEGRYGGPGVVGGHALSWNYGSIGISAMGNYEVGGPTSEMLNAFVSLMSWKSNQHCIDPWGSDYLNGTNAPNYLGHRDTYSTACPGGYMYQYLPWLRNEAKARYSEQIPIIGDIRVKYDSLQGAPGCHPLNEEYPVYDSGSQWIGQAQDFTNGRLIWNKDTRQVFWVHGAILDKYDATGREAGWLGLPTSDEYGVPGGRANTFYGGHIYWSASTGAHEVHGAILDKLISLGGVGVIGIPATDEFDTPGFTGFKESDFLGARIYWSSSTGARAIYGAIHAKFVEKGALRFFGLPLADETNVEGVPGGRMSTFENHVIYWSALTGAHEVHGAIYTKYQSLDDPGGFVGLPTTDEMDVSGVTGARESRFQGANIYWSPAFPTDAYEVHGAIRAKYVAAGGPALFGLPTTDEGTVSDRSDGARFNDFERAYISWTPSGGAREVHGAIFTRFKALGGVGFFGLPTTDETGISGVAGARMSQFEKPANIYWSPATGAHAVHGSEMLSKYQSISSWAGLPTSDTENITGVPGAADARRTVFQGASIYWSSTTGAWEVHGGIRDRYTTSGGPGGPAGVLGLPTSDEKNVGGRPGARVNDFQNGNIYWSSSTGAWDVHGAIYTKYLALGGPAGFVGLPKSDVFDISEVTGAQEADFQGANIYTSAAGTFEVHGGIRDKYVAYGGPASDLGLPVSDEYSCSSGRRSDFQGGNIYWDSGGGANVNIGAGSGCGGATVTSASTFNIWEGPTNLATLNGGQAASVTYSGGLYTVRASTGYYHAGATQIRMAPVDASGIMQVTSYHDVPSWNPSLDDNRFRGTIEIRYSPVSNAVWVINELPIEWYLRGIAETSSSSPAEHLKTMTVAARSYALHHVNAGGKYYSGQQDVFHLKNSRNGNGDDQQYKGYGLEERFPALTTAVTQTAGQVITYNGSLAIATYFSNSDGRTRSAQEAWGTTSWPWLASVSDPDCNGMTLNGHGVGLSGYGALKRAERGDSYTAILTYYFTGTQVQTVDTGGNIRVAITRL